MEQGYTNVRESNDKSFLLKDISQEQKMHREHSPAWYSCQEKINQLVAERYLQYLNR